MSLLSPDFDVDPPTVGDSYGSIIPIYKQLSLSEKDRINLIRDLRQIRWIEELWDFTPIYNRIKQWIVNKNINPELLSFSKTGSKTLCTITIYLQHPDTCAQDELLLIILMKDIRFTN